MAFSDAGISNEYKILRAVDPRQVSKVEDERLVEGRLKGKVEGFKSWTGQQLTSRE